MSYYDTECSLNATNVCICTKPFDAENARNTDIDAPCTNGDSE